MSREQYRQGDLVLEVCYLCDGEQGDIVRSAVLAVGEKHGHEHVLTSDFPIELIERGDTLYVRLLGEATLTHPEHAQITLPRGEYERLRQSEFDPKVGKKNVRD